MRKRDKQRGNAVFPLCFTLFTFFLFLSGDKEVLLHLRGLILVVHAGVPETGNIDGIVLDEIDQLVQSIDDDASVGLRTVAEQRVNLSDARTALQAVGGFANHLLEFVLALGAKLLTNVVCHFVTLLPGAFRPFYSHTASICSLCSSASSRSYSSSSSFHRSSSSIPRPPSKSRSASSSMAFISAFV